VVSQSNFIVCSTNRPVEPLGLIAVQPGLYLGLSRAICAVMFQGDLPRLQNKLANRVP